MHLLPRHSRALNFSSSFAIALAISCFLPFSTPAQNQKGAGIIIAADADAKDLGLPIYPGSRRHKDKDCGAGHREVTIPPPQTSVFGALAPASN